MDCRADNADQDCLWQKRYNTRPKCTSIKCEIMSVEQALLQRSDNKCELCGSTEQLAPLAVEPSDGSLDQSIVVCETCRSQIADQSSMDVNHWRCLNDSMWSQEAPVQVMAYRHLFAFIAKGETWAKDSLDMLYLEPEVAKWAKQGLPEGDVETTYDVNKAGVRAGYSVTLVKDLVVKGANFTAKQGTLVKNISLTSNPKHIEGKVNGSHIVIIAEYCKKA